MDDIALLRQFVSERSQGAFAELVRRYVDMVWSAARRQTGSAELADQVTQTVFATLAQKANSIREGEAIGGWLLVTTRYTALNTIRSEARRRRHEREAAAMKREAHPSQLDPAWESVAPLLDEGVAKLKREDRDAVVLRYFQGKSTADVAAALNVSPEAAQKRLSRAVDRLRTWLAARGVRTSADALGLMLASQAVGHAPEALAAALAATSVASSAASSVAGKGAIAIMATVKTKVAVAATSVVLLAGVTGTVAYNVITSPGGKSRQVRVDATQQAVPTRTKLAPVRPVEQWMPKFREIYALKPGENVKFVPRPWIAERTDFYRKDSGESQYEAIPAGPDRMRIEDDGLNLNSTAATFGGTPTVRDGVEYVLGIEEWDVREVGRVLSVPMRGDWVVRKGTTPQQRTQEFLTILSQATKRNLNLEFAQEPREAVIVRGTFKLKPVTTQRTSRGPSVVFYRGTLNGKEPNYIGGTFLERISETCNIPVVSETTVPKPLEMQSAGNPWIDRKMRDPQRGQWIDEMLANVAAQTSLTLTRETRTLPVWTLNAGNADWRTRIDEHYQLRPGEDARLVTEFIPERIDLMNASGFADPGMPPPNDNFCVLIDNGGSVTLMSSAMYRDGFAFGVKSGAHVLVQNVIAPPGLLDRQMIGDWVFRNGITQAQAMNAVAKVIKEQANERGRFELQQVERDVLVAGGAFAYTPLPNATEDGDRTSVHIFRGAFRKQRQGMSITQNPREFIEQLGEYLSTPVAIDAAIETTGPVEIIWHEPVDFKRLIRPQPPQTAADEILSNVAKQTGLTFKRDRRVVPTWVWVKGTP